MSKPAKVNEDNCIFDGEDVQLYIRDVPADTVLVTFSNRPNPGQKDTRFGVGFCRKNDYGAFYIAAKWPHWWQSPEMATVCAMIRDHPLMLQARHRLAYGTSMGGYGALRHGAELGCENVLAGAPQASVNPATVPFENRWNDDVARIRFLPGEGLRGLAPGSRYFIAYDNFNRLDSRHIALLGPTPDNPGDIRYLRLPLGGHTILNMLLQGGELATFVKDAATGELDVAAMRHRLRARRRDIPQYFDQLSRLAQRRRHSRIEQYAAGEAFRLQPGDVDLFVTRAKHLRDSRQNAALIEACDQHIALNPKPAEAWRFKRLASHRGGDPLATLEVCRTICTHDWADPDDYRWWVRMAAFVEQYDEALDASQRALDLFPGARDALAGRFDTVMAVSRFDEALEIGEAWLALPDLKASDRDHVLRQLARIPRDPNTPARTVAEFQLRAHELAADEKFNELETAAREFIARKGQLPEARRALAQALFRQGRLEECLDLSAELGRTEPDNYDNWRWLFAALGRLRLDQRPETAGQPYYETFRDRLAFLRAYFETLVAGGRTAAAFRIGDQLLAHPELTPDLRAELAPQLDQIQFRNMNITWV